MTLLRGWVLNGVLAAALTGSTLPDRAAASFPVREVAISAVVVGAGFALDSRVHPSFPERGASLMVEEPGEIFGEASFLAAATGGLTAGGLALHRPPLLRTGEKLGLAVAGASASAALLKLATRRERPDGSNAYSFPSGHSAAAFAAATVIDREVGGVAGWLAYGAAAMVGESRIADNHHYLSDVVAGAVLGRAVGRLLTLHHHEEGASAASPP